MTHRFDFIFKSSQEDSPFYTLANIYLKTFSKDEEDNVLIS
jgi:hypothetical protein